MVKPAIIKMKKTIRLDILGKRRLLSQAEIHSRSKKICNQLINLEEFKDCKNILIYVSMPDEVQTKEIFRTGLQQGKTLVSPIVQKNNKMLLLSVLSETHVKELLSEAADVKSRDWIRNKFGIIEPREETIQPISLSEIEFIVVPGIAFDRRGRRLGFGGGYYDHLLEKTKDTALAVALAFDFQILSSIPTHDHDQDVDMIITDSEIIKPSSHN